MEGIMETAPLVQERSNLETWIHVGFYGNGKHRETYWQGMRAEYILYFTVQFKLKVRMNDFGLEFGWNGMNGIRIYT